MPVLFAFITWHHCLCFFLISHLYVSKDLVNVYFITMLEAKHKTLHQPTVMLHSGYDCIAESYKRIKWYKQIRFNENDSYPRGYSLFMCLYSTDDNTNFSYGEQLIHSSLIREHSLHCLSKQTNKFSLS